MHEIIKFNLIGSQLDENVIKYAFKTRDYGIDEIEISSNKAVVLAYRFYKTSCHDLKRLFRRLAKGGVHQLIIDSKSLKASNKLASRPDVLIGNGKWSYLIRSHDTIRKVFVNSVDGWRREISSRTAALGELGMVPVLDSGEHWIEMPYHENTLGWSETDWRWYPLSQFDRVMEKMQALHAAGFYMVDWNHNSFIFTRDGDLKIVDFEYLYEGEKCDDTSTSPDFTGVGHPEWIPERTAGTFDTLWRQLLGVSYNEYLTLPRRKLQQLRFLRLITKRIPSFIWKKVSDGVSFAAYEIIFKSTSSASECAIKKRFL